MTVKSEIWLWVWAKPKRIDGPFGRWHYFVNGTSACGKKRPKNWRYADMTEPATYALGQECEPCYQLALRCSEARYYAVAQGREEELARVTAQRDALLAAARASGSAWGTATTALCAATDPAPAATTRS